jgi:hypothetical protein
MASPRPHRRYTSSPSPCTHVLLTGKPCRLHHAAVMDAYLRRWAACNVVAGGWGASGQCTHHQQHHPAGPGKHGAGLPAGLAHAERPARAEPRPERRSVTAACGEQQSRGCERQCSWAAEQPAQHVRHAQGQVQEAAGAAGASQALSVLATTHAQSINIPSAACSNMP